MGVGSMEFRNTDVRRKDRLLEEIEAISLLNHGEYGVLSMQAEEGGGYGVPLNYAWDGKMSLYIHCAPEGRKLRCLVLCDQVSFCVVGRTRVAPSRFTTEYESLVIQGTARTGLAEEERKKALELLLEKYSPLDLEKGLAYAEKSFHRTDIIRIDIQSWSGKCKRL